MALLIVILIFQGSVKLRCILGLGSIKFGIPALHRLPDTMFAKTTPSYHIRLKTSFDAKQSK